MMGLATLLLASAGQAQILSENVPADSVAYIGWRGTIDPGPGFAGSKWEAILKDSQFGRLIDETFPAIGLAAERRDPAHGATYRAAAAAAKHLIRHSSAAFLEFEEGKPRGGVLCRAGTDAKELQQVLQNVVGSLPARAQARVVTPGDSVGIVFGYPADVAVEGGLDQQAEFKNGLARCVKDPSSVLFINLKAARELVDGIVDRTAPAKNAELYHKFIDASGLAGVNALTSACGFAGPDWQNDFFLDAPAPRRGLLALKEQAPWNAELIGRVPASANGVSMYQFDSNAALKTLRQVAADTDPAAADAIDKVIGGATMAVGKNIQDDLLASLGGQWVLYTSPEISGTGAIGTVLVNKLANPMKARQSLAALSIAISNSSKNLIQKNGLTLAGRMTKVGDLSVFYLATPLVSPAWVIKDGYLYMGAYPQTVIAAARYSGASIADNPAFAGTLKSDKSQKPLAVSYTDVKATLSEGYGMALLGSRTLLGLSDIYLAATPEPVMPTLPAFYAQAAPSTSVTWADDEGLHSRSHEPFPAAGVLANLSISNLYVTNIPLMTGIALPSLGRSREAANRVKSASNLRQIGLACLMYANENRDKMPPDFNALLHTQEITVDVFVNPRTTTNRPEAPTGTNAVDYFGNWANQSSDYAYVGAGKTTQSPADHVLAYEKPERVSEGINVLFFDGHVDFISMLAVPATFAPSGLPSPLAH
jgi:prepilin-type processing-associated H-X9-DG protein